MSSEGGLAFTISIPTIGHLLLNGSANGTSLTRCEQDVASSSVSIGIAMGLCGSVFINSGQNLQSMALQSSPEVRLAPHKSKAWRVGMGVFIFGSILNFVAFTFASASVLVPIEAVQFVTNCVFNKYVNKKPISRRMARGVALAVTGVVVTVVFGSSDARCFTIDELAGLWTKGLWWGWLVTSLSLAGAARYVFVRYTKRLAVAEAAGTDPPPHHAIVLPVSFAVSSALTGGAQMIVHSKAVAELIELIVIGSEPMPMATWYFWLEVTILTTTGFYWLFKLNESLALYDPLFIIPLMQSSYILFGVVAGGIYFEEFAGLHRGPAAGWGWPLFLLGMGCIMGGLALIAPPPTSAGGGATDRVKITPLAGTPRRTSHEVLTPNSSTMDDGRPLDRYPWHSGCTVEVSNSGGKSRFRKLGHRRTPSTSGMIAAAALAASEIEISDVHMTIGEELPPRSDGAGGAPELNSSMRVRQCSGDSRPYDAPLATHADAAAAEPSAGGATMRRRPSRDIPGDVVLPDPAQTPSREREVVVLQTLASRSDTNPDSPGAPPAPAGAGGDSRPIPPVAVLVQPPSPTLGSAETSPAPR